MERRLSRDRSGGAPGAQVRAEAARLTARIVSDGVPLERVLTDAAALSERDQRLLLAIVYGALRWHDRLDWQLGELLTRSLKRKDAVLGALLRVGLFELQFLRVPEHAAVSACVDGAAALGFGHAKGLVNAVLRRFLRERDALDARMQGEASALYSHPSWLIEALRRDWPERWVEIVTANNERAPMWLRVNTRRCDPDDYARQLEAVGIAAVRSTEASEALLLETPVPAASLPGFGDGLVSVQDAAAQLAVEFLSLEPGLRVLDACAAPGGKTAHMLERCPDLAGLVAIDRDVDRLATVAETLARLGLEAELVHADAADTESWWDGRGFDRVLIDAPCSALGVVRRHPDIKRLRRPADLATAVTEQARLLERLWPLVAPGGRLVYVTCTVLADENDRQIERFAAALGPESCRVERTRQRFPGEANMDGFYYACLLK